MGKLTKKTKILIIVLSVVAAIGIAVGITLAVLLKKPDPPAKGEGQLYQTDTVNNGMAGYTYMTFNYEPEPADKEEGKLYGNVFHTYCSFAGSDGYQEWLSGTWDLAQNSDGTFGDLTLTGYWADGATTYLDGATSGEPKTYKPDGTKYSIAVYVGGVKVVTLTLDVAGSSKTYIVKYMLNDGSDAVHAEDTVMGLPTTAHIKQAPKQPEREGYRFAGWQTKAEITKDDIVNGVSKYLWLFGDKLSLTGVSAYGSMDEETKERLQISEGVMLLDSKADDNNTVTLYARWVQEKEISDEAEFRAMGEDLYGAYKLTADITLTEGKWTSIGAYFTNYEYYSTEWWTYCFRGSLDGNGHKVYGLHIDSAQFDKNYSEEGSVWFDDGVTCNGTVGMFGAIAGAEIKNITFVSPKVDVTYSGDFLYAGVLAAFDMSSHITNVKAESIDMKITFDEKDITFRRNLFTCVGGLIGGGWSNYVTGCEASGNLDFNAANKKYRGGEVYFGGLIGENYSTMKDSKADVTLKLDYVEQGTVADDRRITINVGGIGGSGTEITGCEIKADITVNAVKQSGESSVNVGGIVGSQRYMTTSNNKVTGSIVTTGCNLDAEKGKLNAGGVGGRIDVYYMLQILAYTPIVSSGAENNEQDVTIDGVKTDKIIDDAVSAIPGCWYIAKGDQPKYGATSNIEQAVEAYGSYLPLSSLQDGIVFIVNKAPEAV